VAVDRESILKRADGLLRQGRLDAAIDEYVRLVKQQPEDWGALNTLGDLYAQAGRSDKAVEQYTRIADYHFAEGFFPKAQALYKKALKCQPKHEHTLRRLAEIATKQGLLANARQYLQQLGGYEEPRAPQARGVSPPPEAPVPTITPGAPVQETAPPSVVVAERFVRDTIAVETPMLSAEHSVTDSPPLAAPDAIAVDHSAGVAPPPLAEHREDAFDIDLTDALGTLTITEEPPALAPLVPAPPLDAVFAELRAKATAEQLEPSARAQYEMALHLLRDGRSDEAIAAFEMAAQSPTFRFKAGSELGRLLAAHGDLAGAIEWFERALDGSAPTPVARAATLYDLADILEQTKEPARALAVLLELETDVPSFRDVDVRLTRLKDVLTAEGIR
jgi:tetratricopeptide (TPR) repeat protein